MLLLKYDFIFIVEIPDPSTSSFLSSPPLPLYYIGDRKGAGTIHTNAHSQLGKELLRGEGTLWFLNVSKISPPPHLPPTFITNFPPIKKLLLPPPSCLKRLKGGFRYKYDQFIELLLMNGFNWRPKILIPIFQHKNTILYKLYNKKLS